jgi:GTP cyclohydrolase I
MTVELTIARQDRPEPAVDLVAAELAAAEFLAAGLRPQGVGVVLQAEHACMTLRGVRAVGATTLTSTLLGTLRTDHRSRAEFFALAGVSG